MSPRLPSIPLLLAFAAAVAAPAQAPSPAAPGLLPPGGRLVDPLTEPKHAPFAGGERLRYKLGWSAFTVARATLETVPAAYSGADALHITLTTRTNRFADGIYKVRNLSTSWVAADLSRSLEYTAVQDEGGRQRDARVVFDPAALTVRHTNRLTGEERAPVAVEPGTFDPLGIVFFLRSIDFAVGDVLIVPTSNGKEFFHTIVRVTGKVERRFLLGRREAWVLEPDIKDVGGVFKRSPDGKVRFFLSADEHKLPLRMESEVAVGRFWAELMEAGAPEEQSVAVAEVE